MDLIPLKVELQEYANEGAAEMATRYNFSQALNKHGTRVLKRVQVRDVQINVGKLCNQACNHCHVDAGPKRTEIMTWTTMAKIIDWCLVNEIKTVDITGGAPELNPNFRRLVDACLSLGTQVTSRSNLTVFFESGEEDLPNWYAERRIKLICSLPCYTKENLESQRGKGVFDKSIRALQLLNELGYGSNPELALDLVYNPGGAFLPPPQQTLEQTYKTRLFEDFGVVFNNLYALTNLPISRFRHYLERRGELFDYMDLLSSSFNPATIDGLMCRHIISVDWQGRIYDCDFNQMLDISAGWRKPSYLWDLHFNDIVNQKIALDSHCFGCTAGAGSSCTGTLA